MKPVHWHPQAKRDADEAAVWYATQGGMRMELAFIDALQAAENLIAEFPASGSPLHAGVIPDMPVPLRFHVLHRFDRYLLYYLDLPDRVEVIRVWDASRGLEALFGGEHG